MTGLLLVLIAIGFLCAHLLTVAIFLARRRKQRPRPAAIGTPPITLLRTVCGRETFDIETLESSYAQDYPDYEVLFCLGSAKDPAHEMLMGLAARHPDRQTRILIGDLGHSANPKLDNLWKGWRAARHDWICMSDSNLLLPPDYLKTLVGAWGPKTGMVSSPAIGTRPAGTGGHLEAAFLNSNQARLQFAADSLGHGYAQGKTLFFNRPLLDRLGGPVALNRTMAEDAAATLAIRSLGLDVTLPPQPFEQPIGTKSFSHVWKRQLRWSVLRHDAFPHLFLFEPINGAVLPTVLLMTGLMMTGGPVWVLLPWIGLWFGAEVALSRISGWPSEWRDILALPLRDVLIPVIWALTYRTKGFDWHGTRMSGDGAKVTS